MTEITLDSLIQEQKERIQQLHYKPNPPRCIGLSYYYYDDDVCYQKWLASREEGGDDVKSARPLRPGRHTCYIWF